MTYKAADNKIRSNLDPGQHLFVTMLYRFNPLQSGYLLLNIQLSSMLFFINQRRISQVPQAHPSLHNRNSVKHHQRGSQLIHSIIVVRWLVTIAIWL